LGLKTSVASWSHVTPRRGSQSGGASNEGLVGITYEVVGTVAAPTLRVNPISAVAPGFIRKFFEFSNVNGAGRPAGSLESTR
jgi:hypothetical protein